MKHLLLSIALLGATPVAAQSTLIGSYTWAMDSPLFGGFSAIELGDDGHSFLALSDRGALASGTISRTNGVIDAMNIDALALLTGPAGRALTLEESDSEGIALAGDGSFYVSFEWTHGLRYFERVGASGDQLLSTPDFDAFQDNASLEAVAIGPDQALYTIPERSGFATHPFPVFRWKDGKWDQPFTIPRRGAFLVVGADFGPDGRLYILERDFIGIGFRSRVRHFAADGTDEQVALESGMLTHDNLEGISVWQDDIGLRMTLISDDNFRSLQKTEVVEYRLTE